MSAATPAAPVGLGAADHAYAHALAVLLDPTRAELVAVEAVRLAGRSRTAALAQADALALAMAGAGADAPLPAAGPAPADLTDLAWALADHRPAAERALVDLALRHGLDAQRLGRALGLLAPAATARAHNVDVTWQDELGPALLARLGAGGCAGLADTLAVAGVADDADVSALVAAAGRVAAHAAACERCTDRARSMVPLRDLLLARPVERAPESVRAAGRRHRFRRPSLPDRPTVGVVSVRRTRRWSLGLAAAMVVAGGVVVVGRLDRGDTRAARVAALTKVAGGLELTPSRVQAPSEKLVLRNPSSRVVRWRAVAGARWLRVRPDAGRLEPGASASLAASPDGSASSHEASVTVTGDDGSTAAATVTVDDGAPTVGAARKGCSVTATAVDDLGVISVVLHWQAVGGTAPVAVPMVPRPGTPGAWEASLPLEPVVWWVSAGDGHAEARTEDALHEPASC